jgi:hypothetical protein
MPWAVLKLLRHRCLAVFVWEEAAATRGAPRKEVGTTLVVVCGRRERGGTCHSDHGCGGAMVEASMANLMASSTERLGGIVRRRLTRD